MDNQITKQEAAIGVKSNNSKKNYKAKFCEICQRDYKDFYQHRKIKHSDKLNKKVNLVDTNPDSDSLGDLASSDTPLASLAISTNDLDDLDAALNERLVKIDNAIRDLDELAALIRLKLNSL